MEEVVTVSLGKVRGASQNDKASKAIREIKRQISKRTDEEVRISSNLNEKIWSRGATNPPGSVEVQLIEREDHLLVETADTDVGTAVSEEEVEDVDEPSEPEQTDEEAEAEEEEREFSAIPEGVRETLKDGTIDEGKEAVQGLNKSDFELVLNFEEKHQNRKGMKKFLKSNMR
jgi:ribosomal protein L31E